ncbi:MAG: hypothetical protein IT310_13450 [Anaerolineales bacterium]|nr:hypothetical protein [Anaerolineales bacterium]
MKKIIGAVLLLITLSACAPTAASLAPTEVLPPATVAVATEAVVVAETSTTAAVATEAATVADTPIPPVPASACPVETAELSLFTNAEEGYCFLYPKEYAAVPPRMVAIHPNGASGGDFLPGDAIVLVSVEAASGQTAAQIADGKIAEAGADMGILRSELLIDGKSAIVVDGLPAQDSTRQVFMVDGERLYILQFTPWAPDAEWFPALESLYSAVVNSFHALPAP